MPWAVECYFDSEAELGIRGLWDSLDRAGVPSLAAVPDASYRPHVSLAVFEEADLDAVTDALSEPSEAVLGQSLSLGALGFFLTEEAVAFLGVVPSEALLSAHRAVYETLAPLVTGYWAYYQPNHLIPHCTLATGVRDKARVVDVIADADFPIGVAVESVNLVRVPGGWTRSTFSRKGRTDFAGPTTS